MTSIICLFLFVYDIFFIYLISKVILKFNGIFNEYWPKVKWFNYLLMAVLVVFMLLRSLNADLFVEGSEIFYQTTRFICDCKSDVLKNLLNTVFKVFNTVQFSYPYFIGIIVLYLFYMLGLSNTETLTLSIDESKSKSSGRLSYSYDSFRISENLSKNDKQISPSHSKEKSVKYLPVPISENDNQILLSEKNSPLVRSQNDNKSSHEIR